MIESNVDYTLERLALKKMVEKEKLENEKLKTLGTHALYEVENDQIEKAKEYLRKLIGVTK